MTEISVSIQKDIERLSKLSIDELGEHISSQMLPDKAVLLFSVLNFIFYPPPKVDEHRYPKLYNGNSRYVKYIADVQRALCKNNWLCEKLKNKEQLSYDEMVFQISEKIARHDDLDQWADYHIGPIPVAILVIKIGGRKFCGCP